MGNYCLMVMCACFHIIMYKHILLNRLLYHYVHVTEYSYARSMGMCDVCNSRFIWCDHGDSTCMCVPFVISCEMYIGCLGSN